MDLVSICIPTYNRAKYIGGAIESCLRQTYENVEVLVVDDKSTDNTQKILKKYNKNPRVRVFANRKNYGAAVSFNKAFRESRGEFIVMCGDDDYLSPHSIERRIESFSPELDIVYGIVKNFYSYKTLNWCIKNKLHKQKRDIAGHGVMFRRRVFEKYGLFYKKLRLNEDMEYWYRIGMARRNGKKRMVGLSYKKIPVLCAYVRIHKGSFAHQISAEGKKREKRLINARMAQINNEGITKRNTEFL